MLFLTSIFTRSSMTPIRMANHWTRIFTCMWINRKQIRPWLISVSHKFSSVGQVLRSLWFWQRGKRFCHSLLRLQTWRNSSFTLSRWIHRIWIASQVIWEMALLSSCFHRSTKTTIMATEKERVLWMRKVSSALAPKTEGKLKVSLRWKSKNIIQIWFWFSISKHHCQRRIFWSRAGCRKECKRFRNLKTDIKVWKANKSSIRISTLTKTA